ncbi:MAG TPA: NAD(P)-dependent oxidoreductase [Terriglobales bacterium]|nr:NAD(P)-dependent oxidoreductase [Terriglobales bacterium]
MKVAFIGLGNMGHSMAGNLLKAGHQLTVWNRSRGKGDDLAAAGAKVANSAAEAAREAEVTFSMLSDDAAVESAVLGENGLLNGLPRGATHVSSSTISVALSEKLLKAHNERGQSFVAAPVFGRPEAAAAAKLFVVVAGESKSVEQCKPLFSSIGQQTFVLGTEPPMANAVKLSGNFLIAAVIECLGEAVTLVRKYGVDPHQYIEMLTSTLFAAPVYKTYGGLVVNEKFEPAGFKLKLGLKDVRLALAAGEAVNAPLPVASLIRDHAIAAIANGMGDLDWSSLSQVAAQNAGLKR